MMNRGKALVKKTGDCVNIQNEFQVKYMSFSFEFDLEDSVKNKIKEKNTFTHNSDSKTDREGKYYICDNGETYHESEVIAGLDEIREYKLKNNLDI